MKDQEIEYRSGDIIGGRYRVHKVKKGGMGVVYLCLDQKYGIPIALKSFYPRLVADSETRKRFFREVEKWIFLGKHPHIVQCHLMENIENRPYMFLEWVASGQLYRDADLRGWLQFGPLKSVTALTIALDICSGLIHAFKTSELIHCDLKPENVLVTNEGVGKITDFGLAQTIREQSTQDPTMQFAGTPTYMAPEQWRGERLDSRTDIYAIGCCLFEMLTGQPPFHTGDIKTLRRQHLRLLIPSVSDFTDVPPALDNIVFQCMAKNPAQRFQNLQELELKLTDVYRELFKAMPRKASSSKEFTLGDYANRGRTYQALGLYDRAIEEYNKAIELDNQAAAVYHSRGLTYDSLQQYNLAIADYKRASSLVPSMPEPIGALGITYFQMGNYEKAIEALNRAIQLDDRSAGAYAMRGDVYLHQRKYELALADFKKTISLAPKFPGGYLGLGSTYLMAGDMDKARSNFQEILRLDPAEAEAYTQIGSMLAFHGLFAESLGFFEKAAEFGEPAAEPAISFIRGQLGFSTANDLDGTRLLLQAMERVKSKRMLLLVAESFPQLLDANMIASLEKSVTVMPLEMHERLYERIEWLRQLGEEKR